MGLARKAARTSTPARFSATESWAKKFSAPPKGATAMEVTTRRVMERTYTRAAARATRLFVGIVPAVVAATASGADTAEPAHDGHGDPRRRAMGLVRQHHRTHLVDGANTIMLA